MDQNLPKYFTLAVSIDCVVFGFHGKELKVLLIKRGSEPYKNHWALPGDLLDPKEDLNNSVNLVLKNLTGLNNLFFEQVETFGELNRHPKGRVITTGYFTLINCKENEINPASFATEVKWFKIRDVNELAFDHNKILASAILKLQESVRTKPIGFELLSKKFTLTELQSLYEAILGVKMDTRNFRKKILQMKFLKDTGSLQENVSHRPAKLYQFDEKKYEMLKNKGFNFEV